MGNYCEVEKIICDYAPESGVCIFSTCRVKWSNLYQSITNNTRVIKEEDHHE